MNPYLGTGGSGGRRLFSHRRTSAVLLGTAESGGRRLFSLRRTTEILLVEVVVIWVPSDFSVSDSLLPRGLLTRLQLLVSANASH